MNNEIKVSVRNLIELVMRSGDIDNSFMSMNRALEGTLAHQKVQKSYGDEYKAEYTLKHSFEYEKFIIKVEGRADGIFFLEDEIIIDEIKSTNKNLDDIEEDFNHLHWGQAKVYGYIYALQNDLKEIGVQLTYFQIEREKIKIFKKKISFKELETFFIYLLDKYIEWANLSFHWNKIRDKSIESLNFPFQDYRKGQRELAVAAYKTIVERKNIFAQAPTGIGKTISTLFPSIKSIKEGYISKIFYLTAKTITREAPINSMEVMMEQGLRAKTLIITAKDKICLNEEVKCNPRDCSYAKGHYDRVNEAIMAMFEKEDMINRERILQYSLEYHVCPFELSLDVSLWVDVIICDYNYVFDPQVYLKRFFEEKANNYGFLIDEAHNLVDRSREMFSCEISKASFLDLKDIFRDKYPAIYKGFNRIDSIMNNIKLDYDIKDNYYQKEEISDLYFPIKNLTTIMEPWLIEEKSHKEYEKVLELYFNMLSYIGISELYDEHYVTWVEVVGEEMILKLYCVDSSYLLGEALKRARGSILFSATLTPLDYHMQLLGGNKEDYHIKLTSPFPKKNLCLLIKGNISTRYKDRENTYAHLVDSIYQFISSKRGNYFVFFPSYVYMKRVYETLTELDPDLNLVLQESNMKEEEREDFLEKFNLEENLVAFAVMGGIFSEGIDLVGEKLVGAVIVGVALPQICFERNIIKDYFNHINNEGFEYAYTYPGMNKILQAAGRVIRSKEDRGAILLIDDRFTSYSYKRLFPREWKHYKIVSKDKDLADSLKVFWANGYKN